MKLSKVKYRFGGALRTKSCGGQAVQRGNQHSSHVKNAMKAGGIGEVGGGAAPHRLDRPGRKMGGRMCKADGGGSMEGPGELANAEQGKYLRDKALHNRIDAGLQGATSAISGAAALSPIGRAKAFRTFMTGAALASGKAAKDSYDAGNKASSEADRFDEVGKKDGGRLTTKSRNALSSKSFALPGRRYPIEDANHARNALARVSANGSPEEKAQVRTAVHRKYPEIGKD